MSLNNYAACKTVAISKYYAMKTNGESQKQYKESDLRITLLKKKYIEKKLNHQIQQILGEKYQDLDIKDRLEILRKMITTPKRKCKQEERKVKKEGHQKKIS